MAKIRGHRGHRAMICEAPEVLLPFLANYRTEIAS
jgi:hypothetical protein